MISPPQTISPADADAAAAVVANETKKKPPRPYTEYNIFFQLERDRILKELEDKKSEEERGEGNEESSPPEERILNQPSDENDILPRPPQFAHLKLAPKWYDSTVRIAQNKLNKSKRKHRKTHGLVGFLDLTKMISKAWAAADAETRGYCKRVADRQLGFYKDELKAIKKQLSDQQQHQQLLMEQQHQVAQSMPLPHMRNDGPHGYHNRIMTHPPPPHYWQHQQDVSHHAVHTGPSYPEQFPRTPPSQETFVEDQRQQGRSSGKVHPLEELMLRRRMYGNRSNSAAPRRSHTTWPSHPLQTAGGSGGERLPHSHSYVSPAEPTTVSKEAVTPSPPRKKDPSTPTLPVKKRLKKEEPTDSNKGITPGSPDSGDILEGGGPYMSSPNSSSFLPSPLFNGSPLSVSSYQRALGPYLTDSPMPYMDFSPQEMGSPMRRPAAVPSHLAIPGSYAATSMRNPHQRGGRSPFTDDLANDILDFDDEEMDYMWNKLANSARARRNAKAAAAKELFRMNHDSSGIASPGNMNALGMAHSFASPAAPPDIKGSSPCTTVATAPLLPVDDEKQDCETEHVNGRECYEKNN